TEKITTLACSPRSNSAGCRDGSPVPARSLYQRQSGSPIASAGRLCVAAVGDPVEPGPLVEEVEPPPVPAEPAVPLMPALPVLLELPVAGVLVLPLLEALPGVVVWLRTCLVTLS